MQTYELSPPAPTSVDVQAKQPCYITTPRHINTFMGRFICQFTGKGTLELTPKFLTFTYPTRAFHEIRLDTIVNLERGSFSRWTKPLRLDFIAVTYADGENQNTICLTPIRHALISTWETNKIVMRWMNALQRAMDPSRL